MNFANTPRHTGTATYGSVIGRAGAGLLDTATGGIRTTAPSWARNRGAARSGLRGEKRTEKVLNSLAAQPFGPTVLHDLRLPVSGRTANVDHAVVCGNRVILIDTKVWLGGTYWSVAGRNFRGVTRVEHTERQGSGAARRIFTAYLKHVTAELDEPITLVWPAGDRRPNLLALRVPGSRLMPGARLERDPARALGIVKPATADPSIVSLLTRLVVSP